MRLDWARDLRDRCVAEQVAFFKQLGGARATSRAASVRCSTAGCGGRCQRWPRRPARRADIFDPTKPNDAPPFDPKNRYKLRDAYNVVKQRTAP